MLSLLRRYPAEKNDLKVYYVADMRSVIARPRVTSAGAQFDRPRFPASSASVWFVILGVEEFLEHRGFVWRERQSVKRHRHRQGHGDWADAPPVSQLVVNQVTRLAFEAWPDRTNQPSRLID